MGLTGLIRLRMYVAYYQNMGLGFSAIRGSGLYGSSAQGFQGVAKTVSQWKQTKTAS